MSCLQHVIQASTHFFIAIAQNTDLALNKRDSRAAVVRYHNGLENIRIVIEKGWVVAQIFAHHFFSRIGFCRCGHMRTRPWKTVAAGPVIISG